MTLFARFRRSFEITTSVGDTAHFVPDCLLLKYYSLNPQP